MIPSMKVPEDLHLDGRGRWSCATCHVVHNNSGGLPYLLRVTVSKSQLCLSCHNKWSKSKHDVEREQRHDKKSRSPVRGVCTTETTNWNTAPYAHEPKTVRAIYTMSMTNPGQTGAAWFTGFDYTARLIYDAVVDLGGSTSGLTRP